MSLRLAIEDIVPAVGAGRFPAKAVVGERVDVGATVYREGHDAVRAELVWRRPGERGEHRRPMELTDAGLDRWSGALVPDHSGYWTYRVDAYSAPWHTWRDALTAKLAAGFPAGELANELAEGERLLLRAARRVPGADGRLLRAAARALRDRHAALPQRTEPALDAAVRHIMDTRPLRELLTRGPTRRLLVERERALTGAWYELFPRSTGGLGPDGRPVHGDLRTAAAHLPGIAAMGFDVLYLPPIHPIGRLARKGRDNAATAAPGDVGSPWAIGAQEGGHDAIHPRLGSAADFRAFVRAAADQRLEVALDLALQCAPDHPWVTEHPEWFTTRADGSIAYAENPPKKYQDIYPLNFDNDPAGLRAEILRVVLHWVGEGVRIFRVDNPHTKPLNFWQWLIERVKQADPDVVFLSEAFTRPAVLHGLAKVGFSQSYTYFTWRTTKAELTGYLRELTADADHLRPNLWVNTPDILPGHLAGAPPAVFAIRAALAATLGPSWGMYAGFELYENTPAGPGREDYLHSEKYELHYRPPAGADSRPSLRPWITRLNRLRHRHRALGRQRGLVFHDVADDQLLAYSKVDDRTGEIVLCVVTLDPVRRRQAPLRLDAQALGLSPDRPLRLRDLATGRSRTWHDSAAVRIDPAVAVARFFTLEQA
ncbi:maltotransferase domain-containing protein [Micromonospora sp. NPDC049171]|uniref:maltotransferase domain-containing protein n=1 Tax=Micromonospora sp. NPDC049171 TaxID=3155770 RepID=UPI0033E623F6